MLRVVLDTVVFVRALLNPKSPWGRLLTEHNQRFMLILSEPLASETLEVLARPKLASKFRPMMGMDMRQIIDLMARAELVSPQSTPALSRDAKDDKFLAAAETGHADYLVTEDNDLLVLKNRGQCQVVDTETFLTILESR